MLVALDLTERQAERVWGQAARTRVKLEIEPRPEACDALLWGTLVERDHNQLCIDLHDTGSAMPINTLIGAACDVRMILSDQLYLFSTYVTEVAENAVPARIILATPEVLQVANRRQYQRREPVEPVPVRLESPELVDAVMANLANIGHGGIACRLPVGDAADALFIGNPVTIEFVLPWTRDMFKLPATVCSKTPEGDETRLLVGLEFVAAPTTTAQLDTLRAALTSETARLSEMNGDL